MRTRVERNDSRYEQFEISHETIERELRPVVQDNVHNMLYLGIAVVIFLRKLAPKLSEIVPRHFVTGNSIWSSSQLVPRDKTGQLSGKTGHCIVWKHLKSSLAEKDKF